MLTPLALAPVFNALPGAYLLLSPDLYIEAVSDVYLTATLTQRETLVGQYLFDAFPDNPRTPEAQATARLRASLARVLATGQAHEMALQHYDVPDPGRPGQFVERYWQPYNTPVLDEQGQVCQLIHTVVDVTQRVRATGELKASQAREQTALADARRERNQLQALLNQAPVAIAFFEGPTQRITTANPRLCAIWDRPLEQVLGRPFLEALPELRD